MKARIVAYPVLGGWGGWQARVENWSVNPLYFAVADTRHAAEQDAVAVDAKAS